MINKNSHFCIESQRLGTYRTIKISNLNNGENIEIIPETGGLINDIQFTFNHKLNSVLDGYHTGEELEDTLTSSYKGSYLCPFPNRIKDGKYTFNDEEYHLDQNFPQENNSIHGLVYDQAFDVRETLLTEKEAKLKLRYISDGSHPGYPFKYEVRIFYTIDDESNISVTTRVLNKEAFPVLYGEGWHPYFKTGAKVDDLKLMLNTKLVFEVDERMIPTGTVKPYSIFSHLRRVDETHFDTCFALHSGQKQINAQIRDEENTIGFDFWSEGYPYLQVYTPLHRTNIAIEPMTCIPDAFNNKKGILYLPPEKEISFSWGINKVIS